MGYLALEGPDRNRFMPTLTECYVEVSNAILECSKNIVTAGTISSHWEVIKFDSTQYGFCHPIGNDQVKLKIDQLDALVPMNSVAAGYGVTMQAVHHTANQIKNLSNITKQNNPVLWERVKNMDVNFEEEYFRLAEWLKVLKKRLRDQGFSNLEKAACLSLLE